MSALDIQIGGDHYKKLAIQPMEYSMANKLDACQHTAIKYVTRFRDKGGVADLEKAKHVIDLLIEFESKGRPVAATPARAEELQADEGWIEWGGGAMPLDSDTPIDARLSDGETISGYTAGAFHWKREGIRHIASYRIAKKISASAEETFATLHHKLFALNQRLTQDELSEYLRTAAALGVPGGPIPFLNELAKEQA